MVLLASSIPACLTPSASRLPHQRGLGSRTGQQAHSLPAGLLSESLWTRPGAQRMRSSTAQEVAEAHPVAREYLVRRTSRGGC